jgi:hypothetical protein
MCNAIQERHGSGRLRGLGIEGSIPGNLRLYWDDEIGNHYYFDEVTQKQARLAVRKSASVFFVQDENCSLYSTILEEMQTSGTVPTVEQVKALRLNINSRFDQFHPTNRQIKIGLVIIRELIDCWLGSLTKYIGREFIPRLSIHWQIEYLPGDGGIYQMLLKGGGNEADTGVHNN